jgi:putative transposase
MQSDLPEWVKDVPCHIRQNAIFEAYQAYTASKECKFRSCKAPRQTMKFNNSNFKQGKWYPRLTKKMSFQVAEVIPKSSKNATQLIKTKDGSWYAVFLEPVEKTNNTTEKIIALDPGVRTFLTGFDGERFVEFGKGDMGRIARLCQHLDQLMSRISKSSSRKQRQKMRKAAALMRTKIRNLIDECHHKIASWLVKNYQIILLPLFETSQMTRRKKRKIRSKTARGMLTWAHYRFKQVLKAKAELSGCTVIDVTEEFTSKTCVKCGHLHQSLGGNKIFKCPHCGFTIGRDFNGAFGILLKALSDTTFTFHSEGNAIVVKYAKLSHFTA